MTAIVGFRYELPNGLISTEEYPTEYGAYMAGCKETWGKPDMHAWEVKVVNPKGERVPNWTYCDKCNYDQHRCPACGDSVPHESTGVHDECNEQLKERAEA